MASMTGCVWAPGQYMETSSYHENKVDTNDFREGVDIQPINGALIAKLIQESRNATVGIPQALQADKSSYEYKIEPQDVLKITVWDHPELTSPGGTFQSNTGNLVYADGSIFYPYVGVFQVAGKTMEQVRAELTKKLRVYIEDPQVSVQVQQFRSQYAYITGQVNKASQVPITDTPLTLMSIVSQAGGVLPSADLRDATLTRNGKVYRLDLYSLYERGAVHLNVLLQHGDIVNIPDNQLNKIFVMGEVGKASTLFIQNNKMSLAEALSDAQGFSRSSDPSEVYVIRGKRSNDAGMLADRFDRLSQLQVYHLDASSPDALILADQFHLQARDVVYVSATALKRFSSVFGDISRIVNTTAQTLILKKAAGL